jgi:hypothetical protein
MEDDLQTIRNTLPLVPMCRQNPVDGGTKEFLQFQILVLVDGDERHDDSLHVVYFSSLDNV